MPVLENKPGVTNQLVRRISIDYLYGKHSYR